jgi:hypothetical protein
MEENLVKQKVEPEADEQRAGLDSINNSGGFICEQYAGFQCPACGLGPVPSTQWPGLPNAEPQPAPPASHPLPGLGAQVAELLSTGAAGRVLLTTAPAREAAAPPREPTPQPREPSPSLAPRPALTVTARLVQTPQGPRITRLGLQGVQPPASCASTSAQRSAGEAVAAGGAFAPSRPNRPTGPAASQGSARRSPANAASRRPAGVLGVAFLATRTRPAYPAMQPAYTAPRSAARSQVVMVDSGNSDAGEAAGCAVRQAAALSVHSAVQQPCRNGSTGDTSLVGHDGLAGVW